MPSKNTLQIDPPRLLNQCIDRGTIELVSILGIGAYGIVYLGKHIHTQQKYAVKLLTNTKVSCGEIAIHSQLSHHPNILTFEKVIHERDMTFILLEYAPDGDLFASITHPTHGLVGNNDAIRYIFLQILDAVEYCHQRGVAHRDLKPENILMFPHWKVKLADFGLATCQSVSAEFGCGSTFYFSPECQSGMIRNHQRIKGYSTQQNDIWSLGVILINFAAGRNPWKQANMQDATFAAFVQKPRHFFRRILPGISDELDRILGRIFCLDPALRISLPELRLRILKCQSFTRQGQVTPPSASSPSLPRQHQQQHIQYHHQQQQQQQQQHHPQAQQVQHSLPYHYINKKQMHQKNQHQRHDHPSPSSRHENHRHHHQQRHQHQHHHHHHHQNNCTATKLPSPSSPSSMTPPSMKWSGSLTETMLAYIQGYTDDHSPKPFTPQLPLPSPPQAQSQSVSSTSLAPPPPPPSTPTPIITTITSNAKQPSPLMPPPFMRPSNSATTLIAPCDSLSSTSSLSSSECSSTLATPDGSLISPPTNAKYHRHHHDSAVDLQYDTCYT